MKTLIKILFTALIVFAATGTGFAQGKKAYKDAIKVEAIKKLIQSKNYIFKASYMYPMGGTQQYLTSPYDVQVAKDTVVAYLPYFGEVYFNAGYNNSADAGIQFTSTKFDYTVNDKRNGSYLVIIKPKDTKNTSQMYLDISATGEANLSVQSTNRQMIRFSGQIMEKEKPKS